MGFSVSGATAVIIVGALLAFGTVYPVLEDGYERVDDAASDRDDRALRQHNSAIEVGSVAYADPTLTVAVNNTGSTTLTVDGTDVLVDGTYRTGYATSIEGDPGRNAWEPGEQLTIELSGFDAKPDRVKVVVDSGVAETVTEV